MCIDFQYTSIDLFSGPGGLCTGFRWAGIKALVAVEWSYWTVQTYAASHNADIFELTKYMDGTMENPNQYFKKNSKTLLIYGDINKVEISLIKKILNERFGVESVDIVTGGAPCESFSMAGDRKEDDERNILYKNVLRVAHGINSKMFLFENVKGLLSKKFNGKSGEMYKHICEEFESEMNDGFSFKLASTDKNKVLLKAIDYGVPQARERVFLVGINQLYHVVYTYPQKTHGSNCQYAYVTVEEALMDLPQIEKSEESEIDSYNFDINSVKDEKHRKYLELMRGSDSLAPESVKFNKNSIFNHKAPNHTKRMFERIKSIKQGENMKKAYMRLVDEKKEEFAKVNFPNKLYSARNRRLIPNEPSFTVTSHCLDEMIHPTLNRALTPREVARLQSFPDWYQFKGPYVKFHSDPEQDQYEQIGDAIPPILGMALGKEVVRTLNMIEQNGLKKSESYIE